MFDYIVANVVPYKNYYEAGTATTNCDKEIPCPSGDVPNYRPFQDSSCPI
jgi:hypothetical protein